LVGYKDEDGEYYGFLGSLKVAEYRLLKGVSERCASLGVLSIDESKVLSDAKDILAKGWIKLCEPEKEFSEAGKQKLEKVRKILEERLCEVPILPFPLQLKGTRLSADSSRHYGSASRPPQSR